MTKENFLLAINHIIDSGHNDIRLGELFDKIINVPDESAKEFASNPRNIVRSIQGFSETHYEACIRIFKAGLNAAQSRNTTKILKEQEMKINNSAEQILKKRLFDVQVSILKDKQIYPQILAAMDDYAVEHTRQFKQAYECVPSEPVLKSVLIRCLDLLRDVDLYGDISMPKKTVEECSNIATNGLNKLMEDFPDHMELIDEWGKSNSTPTPTNEDKK